MKGYDQQKMVDQMAAAEEMIDIEAEFFALNELLSARNTDSQIKILRETIMDLEKKLEAISEPYEAAIQEKQETIRMAVLEQGKSFKCGCGKAVFRKGARKIVWNDDALLGYAVKHPEIEQFRSETEGKASVVISVGEQK